MLIIKIIVIIIIIIIIIITIVIRKSETKGFIIAAQYQQCIGTDPMCRICGQLQETADHLISGCPELAKTEYIQRHNKADAYLYRTICKHCDIKVQDNHY